MCNERENLWYLVQFKPNCQRLAELNLNRQGFKTFTPLQEVSKRRFSKFVTSITPLFPGYIFVSFSLKQAQWTKIRSTIGVLRLVGFGEKPKDVPSHIVEGIMQMCDHTGKLLSSKLLVKGDDVKIIKGPFSDFLATIEKTHDDKRILVLLKFMGQLTKVEVELNQLQSRS